VIPAFPQYPAAVFGEVTLELASFHERQSAARLDESQVVDYSQLTRLDD
jgi:hypothetical protein